MNIGREKNIVEGILVKKKGMNVGSEHLKVGRKIPILDVSHVNTLFACTSAPLLSFDG
jgi:hypothetical protein